MEVDDITGSEPQEKDSTPGIYVKEEPVRQSRVMDVIFIVIIIILGAMVGLSLYLNFTGRKPYLGGCIWSDENVFTQLLVMLNGVLGVFLPRAAYIAVKLRRGERTKENKLHAVLLGVFAVFLILYAGLVFSSLSEYYERESRDVKTEISLPDGREVLLSEHTDEIYGGYETRYVNVWQNFGLTVKELGSLREDRYNNGKMIADGLYSWDYDSGKLTMTFESGGFREGIYISVEEQAEAPPMRIVQEYILE